MLTKQVFTVGALQTNCYFLIHRQTGNTIIIDPGADGDFLSEQIISQKLNLKLIFFTHAHSDHLTGTLPLWLNFKPLVYLPAADLPLYCRQQQKNHYTNNDPLLNPTLLFTNTSKLHQLLCSWNFPLKILAYPGHTLGSSALYYPEKSWLFAGDFIFPNGAVGRTDLPYSNKSKLLASLSKLSSLPPHTLVFPGHESEFVLQDFWAAYNATQFF